MEYYHFYQQCKDYFDTAGGQTVPHLPPLFFMGGLVSAGTSINVVVK